MRTIHRVGWERERREGRRLVDSYDMTGGRDGVRTSLKLAHSTHTFPEVTVALYIEYTVCLSPDVK